MITFKCPNRIFMLVSGFVQTSRVQHVPIDFSQLNKIEESTKLDGCFAILHPFKSKSSSIILGSWVIMKGCMQIGRPIDDGQKKHPMILLS